MILLIHICNFVNQYFEALVDLIAKIIIIL